MSDALQLATAVFGALATFVTGVVISRQSRSAARDQARIETRRVDTETWDTITKALRAELERVQTTQAQDRGRIEKLEHKGHEDRDAIEETNRRLDDAMRRYQSAIRYIRELLAFIAAHVPGQKAPSPPADLLPDFDGG